MAKRKIQQKAAKELKVRRTLPCNRVRMDVDLPKFEGWWARFRDDILAGDLEAIQDTNIWITSWGTIREILARYVENWNFVDRSGKPLPCPFGKPEVFKQVSTPLLYWLGTALVEVPTRGLTGEGVEPETEEELEASETEATDLEALEKEDE